MKNIEIINNCEPYRLKKVDIMRVVGLVLKKQSIKKYHIRLIFVSDSELLRINKEFLNHNYFTDVITFPFENDELLEGEIYISVERAKEQATEYRVKFYHEISRLAIHGVLHLCGFADKTKTEKSKMTELEDLYLSQI